MKDKDLRSTLEYLGIIRIGHASKSTYARDVSEGRLKAMEKAIDYQGKAVEAIAKHLGYHFDYQCGPVLVRDERTAMEVQNSDS